MTVREFQICAFVIMVLLSVSLIATSGRAEKAGRFYNKSLRILTAGILLLALQFGLQYFIDFKSENQIAEGIFLSILILQPAAWMINLSVLYLLRNREIHPRENIAGYLFYMVSLTVLLTSYLTDGTLISLHHAEIVASATFGIMLIVFNLQELFLIRRIEKAIDDYSDSYSQDVTQWIKVSVCLLMLLALFWPVFIFVKELGIVKICALLTVAVIFYYVFNFISFGISEHASVIYRVNEEEEKEEIVLPAMLKEEKGNSQQRVELALKQWMEKRGHLKTGITIQDAVDEMHIPRYLLVQWIKNTEYEVFSRWIAHLRVEEAKLLMEQHPEYSNEAVAAECGFSSRSYFQKVFRDLTGMTPMEYQSINKDSNKRKPDEMGGN